MQISVGVAVFKYLPLKTDVDRVFIDTSFGYEWVDLNTYNVCGKGEGLIFPYLLETYNGNVFIFHVSAGPLVSALSMHYNYTCSVEEDHPKMLRTYRKYGNICQPGGPVEL